MAPNCIPFKICPINALPSMKLSTSSQKMASPYGITNVPKLTIEAVQTVVSYKVTDQQRSCRVLATDPIASGIFRRCLHVVLYYKNVSEEDSGWIFAGWAKETLGKAISKQPILSGRLWRGKDGDGELEIVSNDSGVRLIETQVAVTLSEFLELNEKEEAEAQLVFWNDIDEHDPQFSPLFYVQVISKLTYPGKKKYKFLNYS